MTAVICSLGSPKLSRDAVDFCSDVLLKILQRVSGFSLQTLFVRYSQKQKSHGVYVYPILFIKRYKNAFKLMAATCSTLCVKT